MTIVTQPGSPDEGGSLAEHADTEALPLPLVDPHLLGGVQAGQHRPSLPRDQPGVHVLEREPSYVQTVKLKC